MQETEQMTKHRILTRPGWHITLAETISAAKSGDHIVVDTTAKCELGKRALARMCPDKEIIWVVRGANLKD